MLALRKKYKSNFPPFFFLFFFLFSFFLWETVFFPLPFTAPALSQYVFRNHIQRGWCVCSSKAYIEKPPNNWVYCRYIFKAYSRSSIYVRTIWLTMIYSQSYLNEIEIDLGNRNMQRIRSSLVCQSKRQSRCKELDVISHHYKHDGPTINRKHQTLRCGY